MGFSQNVRFKAIEGNESSYPHPPGFELACQLASDITAYGWRTNEVDNWRDSGWSFLCSRDGAEIECIVCRIADGEWLMQLCPARTPGFVGRAFGNKPSATRQDVYDLAVAMHDVLQSAMLLEKAKWQWDDFPSDERSTAMPQPAP